MRKGIKLLCICIYFMWQAHQVVTGYLLSIKVLFPYWRAGQETVDTEE